VSEKIGVCVREDRRLFMGSETEGMGGNYSPEWNLG
jgi:hypothetical protein